MKKPVYYVILALLVGVFLFAAYKVGSYYLEKYRSDKVISEANRFVTLPGDSDNNDPTQDPSGDPECPTVQFDELLKKHGGQVADSSLTREDGFLRMEITAKLEPPISHEEALAFMKENTGVRRMSV